MKGTIFCKQCVLKSDFANVHHGSYPLSLVTQNNIKITDTKTGYCISIFDSVCGSGWGPRLGSHASECYSALRGGLGGQNRKFLRYSIEHNSTLLIRELSFMR